MALALDQVTAALERLAPLAHAEPWDNVGLLLEPLADRRDAQRPPSVSKALLTVDLSAPVLDEARARDVDLVVAYHPPLFRPLTRLRAGEPHERLVTAAARDGIAIYSPHTALDAAPGGLNDWLAETLGPGTRRPLVPASDLGSNAMFKLVVFVPHEDVGELREALSAAGAGVIGAYRDCSFELAGTGTFFGTGDTNPSVGERGRLERVAETRLELVCPKSAIGRVADALKETHPYEEPAWDLYPLAAKPRPGFGSGRSVELEEPATLDTLVERVKAGIGRSWLRVAASPAHANGAPIRRVAVAAGSGGKLFENASGFDLYVTGELRHHDTLDKLAQGASVILCEHSSSERGFLPIFAVRLAGACQGEIEAFISDADREPFELG